MAEPEEQISLTIDGKTVSVPKGTVVVDAARTVNIDIPVFCYHEKLGPFGCCRMCLVEVEKMPKLATACTLTASPGMVVKTDTPKVTKGRQGVLEFTLLNHPLDCPVCDKGGECPLQNNTFNHGPGVTRTEFPRYHRDKATPLSPVITIDRERCIACQRCTRYSDIIEKETALVMSNRGFQNRVSTFCDRPYDTRFSGNVIDICPVGALTNTTYRFKSRNWDLDNTESLCAHCGCNCNIVMGTRLNRFMRVQARCHDTTRSNDFVDDGWICDKARFGHGFLESGNRVLLSRQGQEPGETLQYSEAAGRVVDGFRKIVEEHGAESVGFIGSPHGTNEELYLYQKLFRLGFGTNNIDHKTYPHNPGLPVEHYDFQDIESAGMVLLIASDPAEELPILDLRLKKAVSRLGVKLAILNDQKIPMDPFAEESLIFNIGAGAAVLQALANALRGQANKSKKLKAVSGIQPAQIKKLAGAVRSRGKLCVIYNPEGLMTGPALSALNDLLSVLAELDELEVGAIPAAPGTNAVGAMDMGVLPGYYPGGVSLSQTENIKKEWGDEAPLQPGLTAMEMIQKATAGELKALLIYRANPVADFPGGRKVAEALKKLDLLVVHDMLETETTRLADIVIASNGPGYDEGTTTNIGGRVQYRRRGLVNQDHPPDWMIVSRMLQALGDETRYRDSFGVTGEIASRVPGYGDIGKQSIREFGKNRAAPAFAAGTAEGNEMAPADEAEGLKLRVAHSLFAHDKILDASSPLAHQFKAPTVHLHEEDAEKLGVAAGDEVRVVSDGVEIKAEAVISNRCNPGGVVIPRVSDEQGVNALMNGNGAVSRVQIKK